MTTAVIGKDKQTAATAANGSADAKKIADADSSDDDVPLASKVNLKKAKAPIQVEKGKDKPAVGKAAVGKGTSRPSAAGKTNDKAAVADAENGLDTAANDANVNAADAAKADKEAAPAAEDAPDKTGAKLAKARKKRAADDQADGKSEKEPASSTPIKRERKPLDLPRAKFGQNKETPLETDPLRKFYSSLLAQRPKSAMAQKWCFDRGLMADEEALAYIKATGKSVKSPTKPSPAPRKSAPKVKSEPKSETIKGENKAASSNKSSKRAAPAEKRRRATVKYEEAESDDDDDEDKSKTSDDDAPATKAKKQKPSVAKPKTTAAAKLAAVKRGKDKEGLFSAGDSDEDSDDQPIAAKAPKLKVAAEKASANAKQLAQPVKVEDCKKDKEEEKENKCADKPLQEAEPVEEPANSEPVFAAKESVPNPVHTHAPTAQTAADSEDEDQPVIIRRKPS